VALIDIRGYNSINHNENVNNHHNSSDNHHISHYDDNNDTYLGIPQTVFATARCTLDQLHRQQHQPQPETPFLVTASSSSSVATTTATYLECPIITSNKNNTHDGKDNDTHPNSAAHVYGYHPSGGMISTRYNMYREGFVFSDQHVTFDMQQTHGLPIHSQSLGVPPTSTTATNGTTTSFGSDCLRMFTLLHTVADIVLSNVGQHLELPRHGEEDKRNTYIQEHYGPTIDHSQWHLKRYTDPPDTLNQNHSEVRTPQQQDPVVLLPSHTDPSLISIVVLDRPHIQSGAMGLQYLQRSNTFTNAATRTNNTNEHLASSSTSRKGEWVEIPYSGHDVAIVFVGSILQYITNGYFTAVKHRVVYKNECRTGVESMAHLNDTERAPLQRQRMAATLFCRPNPSALLETVPSPFLIGDGTPQPPPTITFEEWMSKTSRNYQKAKLDK
jgi:isopenicillin N synthase-like dioxygenase